MARVLIVEDEKALSDAYKTILSQNGYDAATAANGEEALADIEASKPDVILLDMNMPKMNGIEFLRKLDEIKGEYNIVIFSNQDVQAEIDEAFQLGAKRYILKSWASPQDLVRVVEEALEEATA